MTESGDEIDAAGVAGAEQEADLMTEGPSITEKILLLASRHPEGVTRKHVLSVLPVKPWKWKIDRKLRGMCEMRFLEREWKDGRFIYRLGPTGESFGCLNLYKDWKL